MRVLITGAASGIGLALARILAGNSVDPARLLLVDRDEARLNEAVESLRDSGATLISRADR